MKKVFILKRILAVICIVVLILECGCATTASKSNEPEKVIIDCDMGADCDDAGALATAFELEREGKMEVLGVIASSKDTYSIGAIDAIASFYGRGDDEMYGVNLTTNVGCANGKLCTGTDGYSRPLASETDRYRNNITKNTNIMPMRDKYYSILEDAKDKSITVVVIGHTVGLYSILQNADDSKLFHTKVKKVCFMTYTGTEWLQDYNFSMNNSHIYTQFVLDNLYLPSYFGCTDSHLVLSGKSLRAKYDINNPVKRAFDMTLGEKEEQCSWDQLVVMFAALGDNEWFRIESKGQLEYNPSAVQTRWNPKVDRSNHFEFKLDIPADTMDDIVEDYMTKVPFSGY